MTGEAEHDHEHHHHDFGPGDFVMVTPGMLVDDVQATADYYREVLGFEIVFTWEQPPTFAVVDRGGVSLHLMQSRPPGRRNSVIAAGPGNGADLYINVIAIDQVYTELKERGANIVMEPQDQTHGMREFVIDDANGYRIIFGEPVASK